jgi:hypothetical protein
MTAYYNEIDPFAAAWLRELIKDGLIAPGDVDERSIEDVVPDELTPYTQCHFFAGIGGWSLALRMAGWPDDRPVFTGSAPCQPFSTAGKGDGFADDRHLWPSFLWHIQQCGPRTIFGEQVASADALRWWDVVAADLMGASVALQSVSIDTQNFLHDSRPKADDFVYLDPPYDPIKEGSFTSYSQSSFGKKEQSKLADRSRKLADRGVKIMASNSDTPLIRELYHDFKIHEVSARRSINSKGADRGAVKELIITSY